MSTLVQVGIKEYNSNKTQHSAM